MNTDEAYQQCEQITWEQARNFAYGIRLLPRDKRRALAAVYAFARRIDDIGDGDLPPETKTAQLEQARDQVHALVAAVKDARDARRQRRQRHRRQRPGAGRPGRLGHPLRRPAGGVHRAHRRLPGRREPGQLQDVRRPALVLPLRGRLDRPALARHLRRQPPGEAGQAGRRPRRRAADHQHPARCPRGLPQQPHLPAGRGPDQVRHRVRPVRRARAVPVRGHAGAVRDPGRVRGGPRPRVVRLRPAAAGHDRPPQRGLHRRDGRHLPPPPGPDRGQPACGPRGPDVPSRQREGAGRGRGPGRPRPLEVPQGGRP